MQDAAVNQLSEQLSTLNERMDDLSSQIEDFNTIVSSQSNSMSQQNLALQSEACNGSGPTSLFVSNLGNGTLLPSSSSYTQLNKDSPLMEEVRTSLISFTSEMNCRSCILVFDNNPLLGYVTCIVLNSKIT